jgi:hypothetical protein
MFAKTIIDSDAFLEMPQSTQLLYFHFSMRADDDGFINKPKSIMRETCCKEDDIKILIAKKFIIPFESGIIVIKHWKIHNFIAKDRYIETKYKNEKSLLALDENKAYTSVSNSVSTECIQNVNTLNTQVRLGKDRLGKDSIKKDVCVDKPHDKKFVQPDIEEVKAYCKERNNNVDAEKWFDFYESKGWMIGKNKMKSWQAAIRTWEKEKKPEKTGTNYRDLSNYRVGD